MATTNKRLIADYSKLPNAPGGSYVRVFVRLRPPEASNQSGPGELPYEMPEPNKIGIKENKDPFPTEHMFSYHRVFDKDCSQDVSASFAPQQLRLI